MKKFFIDDMDNHWEYYEIPEGLEIRFIKEKSVNDSVTIPDEIEGKPVVSIAEDAFYCSDIKSVVIPDTVKYINQHAFQYCRDLVNVKMGNSVEKIGQDAFCQCWSIESDIVFPDTLTTIDHSAFVSCFKIKRIKFGNSLETIKSEAFSDCRNLEEAIFPESLKHIGDEAFRFCRNLTSINIGKGTSTIGELAFDNCDHLVHIYVSTDNEYFSSVDGNLYDKDVKVLIQYATGKKNEFFTIPESVKSIKTNALCGCKNIKQITVPYIFFEQRNGLL